MTTFRYLSLVPFLIIAACGDNAAPPGGGSSSGGSSSSSSGNVPQDGGADVIPAASISLAIADATVIQGSAVELTLELTRGASVTGDVGVKFATLPLGLGLPVGDLVFKAGQSTLKVQLSAGIDGKQGDAKLSATATTLDGATSSKKDFTVLVRGAPGTLDKTFGVDGILTLPGAGLLIQMAVRPDGSAFVGGKGVSEFQTVIRIASNGTVDLAFGNQGAAQGEPVENSLGNRLFARGDGSTVISGYAPNGTAVRARRFSSTGSVDSTFIATDDGGDVVKATSAAETAQFLYLGRSVGAATTIVSRFSLSGVADAAYHRITVPTLMEAMTTGTDGLVAMCGETNNVIDLVRLDAAGAVGATAHPFAPSTYRRCTGIMPRKGGGVVAAIQTADNPSFTSPTVGLVATDAAFQAVGAGFGTNGYVYSDPGAIFSLAEDDTGRILVDIGPSGGTPTGVLRYSAAGILDTSFGQSGRCAPPADHVFLAAAVLPNGRILASGAKVSAGLAPRLFRIWN
ncbi:MAG: hypothetical protein HOO96_43715 [Polyangiaceae bacterium]|nr:hypothetical protein [Polyangiaceae bacterium]